MFLQEYFGLEGKVVLVTGGSRGIGSVVALDLAKAGAMVALFSRTEAKETVEAIEKIGGKAKSFIVDVQSESSIKEGIQSVIDEFGTLNVVFNNAGITIHKTVLESNAKDWSAIMNTNLIGSILVAKEAANFMIKNDIHGSIINMASMSGSIVNVPQMQTLYNVSKAAVIHFTKSLAVEWADNHIRVNCISPGYINTEMSAGVDPKLIEQWMKLIPMRRMGEPTELSGAVIFLACDAAGYTTGTEIIIDGGYTCL